MTDIFIIILVVVMAFSIGSACISYFYVYPYLIADKSDKELPIYYYSLSGIWQLLLLNDFESEIDPRILKDPQLVKVRKVAKYAAILAFISFALLIISFLIAG